MTKLSDQNVQEPFQINLMDLEPSEVSTKFGSLGQFAKDIKEAVLEKAPLIATLYTFVVYLDETGHRTEGDGFKFLDVNAKEDGSDVTLSFIFENEKTKKLLAADCRIGYSVIIIAPDGSEVSLSHIIDPGESFETMKNEMFRFFLTMEVDTDYVKFPTKDEVKVVHKSDLV